MCERKHCLEEIWRRTDAFIEKYIMHKEAEEAIYIYIFFFLYDQSIISCIDFSLMNKPNDLQGAKVNLLCINKLVSSICSFYNPEMEVRKSENYLIIHTSLIKP